MNWLDSALDDAEKYLEDSESSLFDLDYAGEGLRLLRENSDVIASLSKEVFSKTLILRAVGSVEEARLVILGANWEARRILRSGAVDDLRQDDETSEVWSVLGDISITMIRALLPFVLAAVLD